MIYAGWGNLKEADNVNTPGIAGRIILKWILVV
jgi:hypothetical protein